MKLKNIYFFRGVAEETNFVLFSKIHIILLLIALVGCLLILKKENNRRLEIIIGSCLLIQQFVLYTWYLVTKYCLISEGLPLYHCRIAIISLGLGLLLNKDILMKIGSYWGIFGSISALLFIGLDPFYFPHITQFSYFIGHYLLLWGALYALLVKNIGMTKMDYKNTLIFTNIYHISMFFLNRILNSNYGYMALSPISIGRNLSPVIYAIIVIIVFNLILTIEYLLCNRHNLYNNEYIEDEEYLAIH